MPGPEDVAVELRVHAAGVVGHEGELGINGPGGGQGDSAQGVGHQEGLHTRTRPEPDQTRSHTLTQPRSGERKQQN